MLMAYHHIGQILLFMVRHVIRHPLPAILLRSISDVTLENYFILRQYPVMVNVSLCCSDLPFEYIQSILGELCQDERLHAQHETSRAMSNDNASHDIDQALPWQPISKISTSISYNNHKHKTLSMILGSGEN